MVFSARNIAEDIGEFLPIRSLLICSIIAPHISLPTIRSTTYLKLGSEQELHIRLLVCKYHSRGYKEDVKLP